MGERHSSEKAERRSRSGETELLSRVGEKGVGVGERGEGNARGKLMGTPLVVRMCPRVGAMWDEGGGTSSGRSSLTGAKWRPEGRRPDGRREGEMPE
jgi:hypothetical protein